MVLGTTGIANTSQINPVQNTKHHGCSIVLQVEADFEIYPTNERNEETYDRRNAPKGNKASYIAGNNCGVPAAQILGENSIILNFVRSW